MSNLAFECVLASCSGTQFASDHLCLHVNATPQAFSGLSQYHSVMMHVKLPPSDMCPAWYGAEMVPAIAQKTSRTQGCSLCFSKTGSPWRFLLVQFLIILCMVGLDVGIQTGQDRKNIALIIANSVGLVVMAIWSWLAYRAVKHEDRKLAWILTVLLPITYILPVVDITLGESRANRRMPDVGFVLKQ